MNVPGQSAMQRTGVQWGLNPTQALCNKIWIHSDPDQDKIVPEGK